MCEQALRRFSRCSSFKSAFSIRIVLVKNLFLESDLFTLTSSLSSIMLQIFCISVILFGCLNRVDMQEGLGLSSCSQMML